jgi:hypothetical protein
MNRRTAIALGQGVALLTAGIFMLWQAGGMNDVVLGFAVATPVVMVVALISWPTGPDVRG